MDCHPFRTAISSRLDGEEPGLPAGALERHLSLCPWCRAWEAESVKLTRAVRIAAADPIPDLTPGILAAIGHERAHRSRASETAWLRVGIVIAAVAQFFLCARPVLFTNVHVAHDLGAFNMAVVTGLLFCAWRPQRVYGLLPALAALVLFHSATVAVDVFSGRATLFSQAHHLSQLIALTLVWEMSHVVNGRSPSPGRPSHHRVGAAH